MSDQLRTKRRILEGIVVSSKMQKTIVVKVERKVLHPIYKKILKKYKKFKVHDPKEKAQPGDRVRIIESRPYSKDKHFRLLEVLK